MIKRIVITVIALLMLLIAGAAWFTLHSETALRWMVTRVETHFAGKLKIGSVRGVLMGPITLGDVWLYESLFDVHIRTLTLDWQPLALLSRRANISRLRAQDADIRINPRTQSATFRFVHPQPPHLPVALVLNDLEVNHLTLMAPELSEPMVVDHALLMARLDNRVWMVSSLRAEGAHVQAQGNGLWEFKRDEQVNIHLQWRLALPQQPVFAGEVNAQGDEQAIQFRSSLGAPFQMQVTATLQQMFTTPSWSGELRFSELDPQSLHSSWTALLAHGELHVQGNPRATALNGDIDAREPKYGDWHSHVDLRWADRILQVRSLDLIRVNTATRFNLSGQVLYADGRLEPALHGEWRALSLPLTGKPWFTSPYGKLEISSKDQQALLSLDGTLANGGHFNGRGGIGLRAPHAWQLRARAQGFQFAMESINKGASLPPMNLQFQAHGDETFTQVDRCSADWLAGRIRARGRLLHSDGQPWQFDITAQSINPGALYPRLPGTLNFTARISGRHGPQSTWKFQLTELDGRLRNAPVQASGILSHAAGVWQFRNAVAYMGNNTLRLDGRVGKQTRFTWKLDAPDLAVLWPDIKGKLTSEGQADLAGAAPVLAFSLNGESLRYRDYALGKVAAHVSMKGAAQSGGATLDAGGMQLQGFKIDELTAHITGSLKTHSLTANLASPYGSVTLAGSGTFSNDIWQGYLTEVTLAPQAAGQWRITMPWQPRITADHFTLPESCVLQDAAQACLTADWQPAQWRTDATLTAVPVHDLQALLPEGLDYAGTFNASLHAVDAGRGRILDLSTSLSPGAIHNVINGRPVTLLAYTSGTVTLHADPQDTTGEVNWKLADGGYMDIRSHISHGDTPSLSGSVQGEIHSFDLVPTLIPAIGGLSGSLKMNISLGGSPMDPTFEGSAAFAGGRLLIPRLGVDITDLQLNVQGSGDHLALDGTAHSGNGDIDLHSTAVKENNLWRAQGKLDGANFRIVDIPEAQVDVSPQLAFTLDNRDIHLDGEVNIPSARLRPRDLTHTAQVSPDQVIVGEEPGNLERKWRVHTRVHASMGQNVNFEGFGLSGNITGKVLAVDEPGRLTTGSGELQIVNGRYSAFRQKLIIDRGRLLFNGGPISDPALDIRALRPPAQTESVLQGSQEQKVGVIVRGTLRQPQVSLYSDPPLPQSQLLNYLLFGQAGVAQGLPAGSFSPLNGPFANPYGNPLATSQGGPTSSSGQIMAYSGGAFLAQQAGEQIGISDVSVQNTQSFTGANNTSLFIGKYLSPRLYVSYGVGLLQPINTVLIRYQLSTKWILEAQSGMANSADLIYTIEH